MSLYVLRHGETSWSRERRHTGRTDVPLTDFGREQAAGVGTLLASLRGGSPFALALRSPLSRASRTAELSGFHSAAVDPRLLEWDYGDYDGRTTAEIRTQRPGWSLWRDGCPNGEDADSVGARVDSLLTERVAPALANGDVLLVAHSHLLRVVAARWLGLPPSGGALFILDPAALGVLGDEHGEVALLRWNISAPPAATVTG